MPCHLKAWAFCHQATKIVCLRAIHLRQPKEMCPGNVQVGHSVKYKLNIRSARIILPAIPSGTLNHLCVRAETRWIDTFNARKRIRDMRKGLTLVAWQLRNDGRTQLLHLRARDTELVEGENSIFTTARWSLNRIVRWQERTDGAGLSQVSSSPMDKSF